MELFSKLWDAAIHSEHDQVKRRMNSEKIKADDAEVDPVSRSAVIVGSDPTPYRVSLSECSCFDFASRGKPCKHIYFLADALGELPPWPKVNRKGQKAVLEAAPVEVERWRSEYEAGNISAKKYTKIADALLSK